jgi:hypothetical protein
MTTLIRPTLTPLVMQHNIIPLQISSHHRQTSKNHILLNRPFIQAMLILSMPQQPTCQYTIQQIMAQQLAQPYPGTTPMCINTTSPTRNLMIIMSVMMRAIDLALKM